MLRFCDSAVPLGGLAKRAPCVVFPLHRECRRTENVISELNGSPVYTTVVDTPVPLPAPAYNSRPVCLAKTSLEDSFILYSKPVYPSAFLRPRFGTPKCHLSLASSG